MSTTTVLLRILACLTAVVPTLAAQEAPKGLHRSLDSFTGDTIVATEYGRLSDRQGCGRTDIAIVLTRHKGRVTADFLNYQWHKVDDPFSGRAYYLNGMTAYLNLDGDIVEIDRTSQSPRLGGSGSSKEEVGAFRLPDGILERIATTPGVKIRIMGTDRTCDGTFDSNITERAAALVRHLPRHSATGS